MGKVISQVRLMTFDLTRAPEGMVNQWGESNKLDAERVNAKRKRTIPGRDEDRRAADLPDVNGSNLSPQMSP